MKVLRLVRAFLIALSVVALPLAEGIDISPASVVAAEAPAPAPNHCCCCQQGSGAVKACSVFGVLCSGIALDSPVVTTEPVLASETLPSRPGNPPFRPPRC